MKREMSRRELFADLAKGPAGGGRMTVREDLKGNRVSLLGYGAMRLPTIDGRNATGRIGGKPGDGYSNAEIDQDAVNEHVDFALEHGVNYFDTSPASPRCSRAARSSTSRFLRSGSSCLPFSLEAP